LDVHVFTIPLCVSPTQQERLARLLSKSEIDRAGRFHHERDRQRFTAAHGETRRRLAQRAGVEPASLSFGFAAHGKPFISGPDAARRWHFNLTHSGDFAVLAVTDGVAVGVDIEQWQDIRAGPSVARRYFSEAEQSVYINSAPSRRRETFFRIWTRKEAVIKALGLGLSMPLDAFDVCEQNAWLAAPRFRVERVLDELIPQQDWHLQRLPAPQGYTAALAIQGCRAVNVLHEIVPAE
jgi:4'-phosphopantetheinyl transferase